MSILTRIGAVGGIGANSIEDRARNRREWKMRKDSENARAVTRTSKRGGRLKMVRSLLTCVIVGVAVVSAAAQQLPPSPNPVAVRLDSKTTALLVLDIAESPCNAQPKCVALVPRIASLLTAARNAGVLVIHSSADPSGTTAPVAQPPFLGPVAPITGERVITGGSQDRFFGTLLDQMLRQRSIVTLVLAGWRENGSLLYTAVGATIRNYTVVVADDATSATQDYDVAIGRYQLLTQLNANANNEPLKKRAVTLSRTDLITFENRGSGTGSSAMTTAETPRSGLRVAAGTPLSEEELW